jgi:hypothetical protein
MTKRRERMASSFAVRRPLACISRTAASCSDRLIGRTNGGFGESTSRARVSTIGRSEPCAVGVSTIGASRPFATGMVRRYEQTDSNNPMQSSALRRQNSRKSSSALVELRLTRRRGCGTRRSCGVRSTCRRLWRDSELIFARSKEPWITRPVHPAVHPVHGAMAPAVSCSEYCPQNHQPCQRECPEPEVPSKLLESAVRAVGQIENEIASDSQRCRRY